MVQHGDTSMAAAVAYVGFALVISCGIILSGRTFAFRIPAAILLFSGCLVDLATGEMVDAAQTSLHTNGTIGDALSAGFATLGWQVSGVVTALLVKGPIAFRVSRCPRF